MTDGTRVLKTVAIPLSVALVFLFVVPKTCEKLMGSKKLRTAVTSGTAAPAPTDTALHITSDSPTAPRAKPVVYPPGLDAQRIQYLIEINQSFTDPYVYRLPKPGAVIELVDPTPADALIKAGWFELAPDGSYTPTPQASLHLPGLSEESQAWKVPLGTRKFVRATQIDDSGDGRAHVQFSWQWEPNEAGRAVKSNFNLHQGVADFAGGGEHPWDLNSVGVDSEWR